MESYISRTQFSVADHGKFETPKGESMTVQGESYTINELFARHMNGMIANIERPSFYNDTEDFDSIDFDQLRHADPFEKETILQEVEFKAKKARQAIEDWRKRQEEGESSDKKEATSKKASTASKSDAKSKSAKAKSEAKQSDDASAGDSTDSD